MSGKNRRSGAGSAHLATLLRAFVLLAFCWTGLFGQGLTSDAPVRALENVGIDQRLNEQVPLDLEFIDETGRPVRLGEFLRKKPVLLTLVYYECPMLCTEVLNGVLRAIRPMSFEVGRDMDILTVSIDPKEGSDLAMEKKKLYLRQYDRPGSEKGWNFLTGDEASIRRLADAVGFRYEYIPQIDQYSHAAAITLLTPEGRVSRYFFGVEYSSRDLRLGIVEASEGKVGTAVDHFLLYCYNYDPATGKYSLVVWRILRLTGFATVLLLAAFLWISFRRERQTAPSEGAS